MYPKTRYVCRLRITDDIQLPFVMTVKGCAGGRGCGRYSFCILNGRLRRSSKQTRGAYAFIANVRRLAMPVDERGSIFVCSISLISEIGLQHTTRADVTPRYVCRLRIEVCNFFYVDCVHPVVVTVVVTGTTCPGP